MLSVFLVLQNISGLEDRSERCLSRAEEWKHLVLAWPLTTRRGLLLLDLVDACDALYKFTAPDQLIFGEYSQKLFSSFAQE